LADELYSIIPTAPQFSLVSIIEYSKNDEPPLFFILVHFAFSLFGSNEVVGRLTCAFIGLLGVVSFYFLEEECNGRTTGVFAALITGTNYFHIYYSQKLRFYTMAFLFATLSYLFFIRAFKMSRVIDFEGYIVFSICLLYTQYFGLIIFGTQALTFIVLLFYKQDLKFILLSITSGIVIVVACIPGCP